MKYAQPYGVSDPDAPYINGDPSIGRAGSIPPAEAFEDPQRELVTLIESAGLTPTDLDLTQVMQAVRSQHMNYALASSTTGGPDQIVVAFNPPLADSVLPGTPLRVKAALDNNGPCTLVVDAIEHPLRRMDNSELGTGEIRGGSIFEAIWNGNGYWSMTNYVGAGGGGPGTSNTYITKIPYAKDTGATANHVVAAFAPAITTLVPGDALEVWLKNNITGPTDIVVNAMPAKAIVRPNGAPLGNGDAVAGQVMLLVLGEDGQFQFFGIIPQSFSGLGVPVGGLILTLGSAAVPGTLKANGALVPRAAHPLLWAFANASGRIVDDSVWTNSATRSWASFSRGDGTTTMRVPELRGEFLRFWDDARGIDPARALTYAQADGCGPVTINGNASLLNPTATALMMWDGAPGVMPPWDNPGTEGIFLTAPFGEIGIPNAVEVGSTGSGQIVGFARPHTYQSSSIQPRGGQINGQLSVTGTGGANETRGRNAAIVPCIVDG